ncbi:glycosyltransferase family 2 protein [Sulfoacidibacillus thermotolerans]|uniref:Glycosyl transferase family 2 n=1 Tax=Sulfoacidibacillus thermotolerans TaxID=1765684 RepID=A0A2U3DAQ4_SULT2|nr:glycosyltransferase family 2 protein [Sulfoacidibacillus thermotolerans]PWI58359.1 glycosyl transferase family 2 [Sulfoacidibacillus thermotolerans]
MSVWLTLVDVFCIVIQIAAIGIGIYQLVISLFSLKLRKQKSYRTPEKSFAIVIPAHNEAKVLSPLIANLKDLDYPRNLYDIFVIADHCDDHTADVAQQAGAIVYERQTAQQRGKGYAIAWVLEQLKHHTRTYDAIVFFDADNLVSRNFLTVMNDKLLQGKQVIQGYLDSKNPFDSWVSVSMALSYWYTNRMWQLARKNLGLPCALGGTGLCIDQNLLQRLGWDATTLAEDTEFGAKCVTMGIIPEWAHEARVYDEKPLTLVASMRQRLRWMRGHFRCSERYTLPLFIQGVRERNLAKLDAALYLFQPTSFLIIFVAALMLLFQAHNGINGWVGTVFSLIPPWIIWSLNILVILQMIVALALDGVSANALLAIPLFPIFTLTWIPVIVTALFTRKNSTWNHTIHTRAIQHHELKSAEAKRI